MVPLMLLAELPSPLQQLGDVVVPALRHVYDINAGRHDELAGDDAVTFGISVYRNSWFRLEQELDPRSGWLTARPEGSLVISGYGYRVHVYRFGHDEHLDRDGFRLDEGQASMTKQSIPKTNGQLVLEFEPSACVDTPSSTELRELVIIHAGNPDDGCCEISIGAPVPAEDVTTSPWSWYVSLWTIQRVGQTEGYRQDTDLRPRHDELPEPAVDVEPVDDDESTTEQG